MKVKKLKSKSGFTMVELLCVVAILTLLTGVITTGMSLCNKTFVETKTRSESSMLASSINNLIADELRYASNVTTDATGKLTSYTSTARGLRNANLAISNGRFVIHRSSEDTPILGEGSYIANCEASDLAITYDKSSGIFTISYDLIYNNPQKPTESRIEEESFQVKSLKN